MKKFLKTLCICLMLCVLAVPFAACDGKKKKESWENDEKATIIRTYEEYTDFVDNFREFTELDLQEWDEEGKYVIFANDIDCNGEVISPWITREMTGLKFKVDGNGHALKNFKLDQTCVCTPQAQGGTANSNYTFTTVALFPTVMGGTIQNLEFKDFEINADLTDPSIVKGNSNDIYVGIVGYSRSSRLTMNVPDFEGVLHTSTYKNIKVTNAKYNIKSGETNNGLAGFVHAIGGFIGIDSDSTTITERLNDNVEAGTQSGVGVRENISVTGLDINVDKTAGGALIIGGISGQTHWMRAEYKNCNVEGKVTVKTVGTTWGDCTAPNVGGQGQNLYGEASQMNDTVQVGGIVGAEIKWNHEIKILGGSAKLDINATLPTGVADHPAEDFINVGNAVGLYCNDQLIADENGFKSITVDDKFEGKCTLSVNGGEKKNVTVNMVETKKA